MQQPICLLCEHVLLFLIIFFTTCKLRYATIQNLLSDSIYSESKWNGMNSEYNQESELCVEQLPKVEPFSFSRRAVVRSPLTPLRLRHSCRPIVRASRWALDNIFIHILLRKTNKSSLLLDTRQFRVSDKIRTQEKHLIYFVLVLYKNTFLEKKNGETTQNLFKLHFNLR